VCWKGTKELLIRCSKMVREWGLLNKEATRALLEVTASELERRSWIPPKLTWEHQQQVPGVSVPDSGVEFT
jgi:hypothetical protein